MVAARAEPIGIELIVGALEDLDPDACFGALLQHPGTTGVVRDLAPAIAQVHAAGGLVAVATDLLACTVLVPPGEQGADVVVGSSQRFGVPLGYGGPHAGFLATREDLRRSMPGRLVGVSVDAAGRPAHRLALQTREQHIRREKATSNICTAQVLLAVIASMYAVYHGPEGLRAIAERVHGLAAELAHSLMEGGLEVYADFFDTLAVRVPGDVDEVLASALRHGLNLRKLDEHTVGVALDETTTPDVIERVAVAFGVTMVSHLAHPAGLPRPPGPHVGVPDPPGLLAPTAPRRRCSATCARCRTRTWRSTAP